MRTHGGVAVRNRQITIQNKSISERNAQIHESVCLLAEEKLGLLLGSRMEVYTKRKAVDIGGRYWRLSGDNIG